MRATVKKSTKSQPEVAGLDEDSHSSVADEIEGTDIRPEVRARQAGLRFDKAGELGDRFEGVHRADVAEHVGVGMERLAHLVAVTVGSVDVQL
jgi:hypothetical protein